MTEAQTPSSVPVAGTQPGTLLGAAVSKRTRKDKRTDPDAAKRQEAQRNRKATIKESAKRREQYTQLSLLWHEKLLRPVKENVLKQAARYLTPSGFDDVVEERALSGLCGYPLCDRSPQKIEQRYHISRARKKVFDMTELKQYCGGSCMVGSRFYRHQLLEDAIYMRSRSNELRVDVLPLDFKVQSDAEARQLAKDTAARQARRVDDMAWYRQSLIGQMNIPETVAEKNPLQIVEHEAEAAEFDVAENLAKLSFADVEGFASEADANRIKKAVRFASSQAAKPTVQTSKRAAAEQANDADLPQTDSDGVLRITVEGRTPEAQQAIAALDMFGNNDSDDADDTDDGGQITESADPGHFAGLFAEDGQSGLSQFGRMWTLTDRMCTPKTSAFLTDLGHATSDVIGNAASYYAAPGDQAMATRQALLSDGVLGELHAVMGRLRIDVWVEHEMHVLVSTLELSSSMAVFATSELRLLGIVFVLALARVVDGLRKAVENAAVELDAELAGLAMDRSLLNMLARRMHEGY
ncbi:hypothetical protein IWW56_003429 [Coemansia sp. RSA 2131]|nr:hypothetical protein IWW56_003429 [Coemansia sp. RSA 2131]